MVLRSILYLGEELFVTEECYWSPRSVTLSGTLLHLVTARQLRPVSQQVLPLDQRRAVAWRLTK